MNVDVQANDFCPDDCPYCDVQAHIINVSSYMNKQFIADRKCRYADICEYAVAQYKKQAADVGYKEGYIDGLRVGRKEQAESEVQDNANK